MVGGTGNAEPWEVRCSSYLQGSALLVCSASVSLLSTVLGPGSPSLGRNCLHRNEIWTQNCVTLIWEADKILIIWLARGTHAYKE